MPLGAAVPGYNVTEFTTWPNVAKFRASRIVKNDILPQPVEWPGSKVSDSGFGDFSVYIVAQFVLTTCQSTLDSHSA